MKRSTCLIFPQGAGQLSALVQIAGQARLIFGKLQTQCLPALPQESELADTTEASEKWIECRSSTISLGKPSPTWFLIFGSGVGKGTWLGFRVLQAAKDVRAKISQMGFRAKPVAVLRFGGCFAKGFAPFARVCLVPLTSEAAKSHKIWKTMPNQTCGLLLFHKTVIVRRNAASLQGSVVDHASHSDIRYPPD